MMDAQQIARRASELPGRFATRLPPETLDGLQLMSESGEYGELALELAATLARTRAAVTAAEQELRALLEATHMPTGPADQLAVHG
jgi:hypothetical protein